MIKLVLIFYLFSAIGCHNNKPKSDSINKTQNDSLSPSGWANDLRCRLLKVDNLKDSQTNPEIRIWITFSMYDSGKVLILKDRNGNWEGSFHQYRFDENLNKERVLISHSIVEGKPKSSWDKYLQKINKFGIYSLNDSDRKENYGLCNDGGTIFVEIVRNNKYTEFVYPCWQTIQDRSQIEKIVKIIRETESEFPFMIFPLDAKPPNHD